MNNQRIVVVDEHCLERRVQTLIEQYSAHVNDVDGASLRRHEVDAGQSVERFREGMAGATHQPTTGNAEFAGERRERGNGPQPGAAVLIALETVAPRNDRGRRIAG